SLGTAESWYVRLLQIVLTSAFRLYLLSTRSLASASSNSGLLGGLVTRMSSSGSTIPRPKKCAQYRVATALAKNGFCGSTIQSTSLCRGSSSADTSTTSPSSGFIGAGLFVRLLVTLPDVLV